MKKVVVYVSGGVVQDIDMPKDVVVEVRDYDCDQEYGPNIEIDKNGDHYFKGIWENVY